MPNGLFYTRFSDWSISNSKGVWFIFIITMFYRNFCSAASDPGLPCCQSPFSAMLDINRFRKMDTLSEKITLLQLRCLLSEGGGRVVRRCSVSYVTGAQACPSEHLR